MPENTIVAANHPVVVALNSVTDDTGRITNHGISLGTGVQGMIVMLKGKRTLVSLVNLDHAPLPISKGQLDYAAKNPRMGSDGTPKQPTPYIAKGQGQLDTGHFISVAVKPVTARANGGSWE